MLIHLIAGTRPNLVKVAPIIRALQAARQEGAALEYRFIHTGQHSDAAMRDGMMEDLEMPGPDIQLKCSGKTRGAMLASVIAAYDALLQSERPDWTVVVGDVTSTLGAALAAKSAGIRVAHVEAGLRSGDRTMPEELNRIATDAIADLHFTTSRSAGDNLRREGIDGRRICLVGNTMADALHRALPKLKGPAIFSQLRLTAQEYILLTMHRPANVDEGAVLREWIGQVSAASAPLPVIFPVHPRTAAVLQRGSAVPENVRLIDAQPYASFLYLQQQARLVVTDSGGVSEETTLLHRPCVTLRSTTERPETVTEGTNVLAGGEPGDLTAAFSDAMAKAQAGQRRLEFWDGLAAARIVAVLENRDFNL